MEPNRPKPEETGNSGFFDNSWKNEVDSICKNAMQSFENTKEVAVNIGRSAINCLDELNTQADAMNRINSIVDTAISSLNDTAKCIKDMASPVTSALSGIYDDYIGTSENKTVESVKETKCVSKPNVKRSDNLTSNLNKDDVKGNDVIENFSRDSCNKLDEIMEQLDLNDELTDEVAKALAENNEKLAKTEEKVSNLQDTLTKVNASIL